MPAYDYELQQSGHWPMARSPKKQRDHFCDYATLFVLACVWGFLFLTTAALFSFAIYISTPSSDLGVYISLREVTRTIAFSAVPTWCAAVLNEVLLERIWRRVVCCALGRNASALDTVGLSDHLRAANLSLWSFIVRLCKFRLSRREWLSAISYFILRWGTVASIASTQYAVSWRDTSGGCVVHKRIFMVGVPLLLHAFCIFAPYCIWLRWPWSIFGDNYHDEKLAEMYQPFLEVVDGSLAKFQKVASALKHTDPARPRYVSSYGPRQGQLIPNPDKLVVKTKVKTGRQILAKLEGLAWGTIMMFAVPGAVAGFMATPHHLGNGEWRFLFVFIFLAQNVFYTQALDFIIWNVSLDGLCVTNRPRPNRSLKHLGFSAGFMVLYRACRQGRPWRASIFIWLFWLQACAMRFLSTLYALCVNVLRYDPGTDLPLLLDKSFWIIWIIATAIITLPLFIIWIFTKMDAPVCGVDGWRWAQLAQYSLYDDGFYGIKNGRAAWGPDVEPFRDHEGEEVA